MKKLLLSIMIAAAAVNASAQNQNEEVKTTDKHSVETNSFWSNWFIQGGVQWSSFYSDESFGAGFSKSPFKKFRSNPEASIAIGKWFTPGIGLRTKVSGIWGKSVTDDDNKGNGIKYWNVQEQAMFNLSNMIFGYNPERVYSFIPFAGAGLARNCSDNKYAIGLSAGLLNQFRVSNRIALNLELGWNILEGRFDGIDDRTPKRLHKNFDNIFYAEAGITVNIGKNKWNKVPDMSAVTALHQSQLDALNEQLGKAKAENDRIREELAEARQVKPEKAECKTVKEVISAPVSIFFNIGEYKVTCDKSFVNVQSIANYAKENNATIIVTGLADSATGSKELNNKLSEKRANAVADKLVEMGVKRENIKVVANGGVSTLTPDSYNRRVIVQIAE